LLQKEKVQRQQEYARLIQERNRHDLQHAKQLKPKEPDAAEEQLDRRRMVSRERYFLLYIVDLLAKMQNCNVMHNGDDWLMGFLHQDGSYYRNSLCRLRVW